MIASPDELVGLLRQYNPWWHGAKGYELPNWHRAAFKEVLKWLEEPPAPRAILLSGARQVGKTTLLLQAIRKLVERGTVPERILYVTFDHPLFKLIGLDGVLRLWKEMHPPAAGVEYLVLDEIQYTRDWATWLKHQVDFHKDRRIVVTGSAIPLATEDQESGVGRWHTIKLPTLSFFEYLQIKRVSLPELPRVSSLAEVFTWNQPRRAEVGEIARPLVPHFHEYLLRGGFPQTALVEDIVTAQKLLREDIVDKVLKRDMTALFGVRRVLELEKTFLYLCLHDGGILDLTTLCNSLDLKKPTVTHFIDLLEAAHLIYRLPPHGYGKEVLRGRFKVYLADPAIAGSALLRGRALLEDGVRLSAAVETAFFKHLFTRYYQTSVGFSYWRAKGGYEVDIVAEVAGGSTPFEVKYEKDRVQLKELKGLRKLCEEKRIDRGYVITRNMNDFEFAQFPGASSLLSPAEARRGILKVPAPLACFWLSESEAR